MYLLYEGACVCVRARTTFLFQHPGRTREPTTRVFPRDPAEVHVAQVLPPLRETRLGECRVLHSAGEQLVRLIAHEMRQNRK